jgi:DNA-binding MarR family transcriptional regulator
MGFNLRKATRAISQFYDEAYRPTGLRGTQFSLLVILQTSDSITVSKLAEVAVTDRTTLTRNLEILAKRGLVSVNAGEDQRTRLVTITKAGRAILEEAYPLWEQAQLKLTGAMSTEGFQNLLESLSTLIKATK